jgi:hypothetical protein
MEKSTNECASQIWVKNQIHLADDQETGAIIIEER